MSEYYNAVPLTDHKYILQIWKSEEEIVKVELQQMEADQKFLKDGIWACRQKIAHDADPSNTLLRDCYHMHLKLSIITFKHKLAVLEVRENELNENIENLKRERDALHIQKRLQYSSPDHFKKRHRPVPKPRLSHRYLTPISETPKVQFKHTGETGKPIPKPRRNISVPEQLHLPSIATFQHEQHPQLPPRPKTVAAQTPVISPRKYQRKSSFNERFN